MLNISQFIAKFLHLVYITKSAEEILCIKQWAKNRMIICSTNVWIND